MSDTNEEKQFQEIINACISDHNHPLDTRLCIIDAEIRRTFNLLQKHPRSVTIFGSARLQRDTEPYQKVKRLSKKIADTGYSVITGGGHGIMAGASEGSFSSEHGSTIGMNIKLPFEQTLNSSMDDSIEFYHFFTRKFALAYSAEAYIFCPGGFGTLDEFFEILTLKQTGKMIQTPIILYGSEFWKPLEEFFKQVLLKEGEETISPEDLQIYTITDNDDEVLDIIKNAPVRTEVFTTMGLG